MRIWMEGFFMMMIFSEGKTSRENEARTQIRARSAWLSTTFFLEERALISNFFSGRSYFDFQIVSKCSKPSTTIRFLVLKQLTFQPPDTLDQLFQFLPHLRQPAHVRVQSLVFVKRLNGNSPPDSGADNLSRKNAGL